MIRIRVIPAHSCSVITQTEQFKWTQILGDVVTVTTSSTCKTHIMIIMPALGVTCIYPHPASHAGGDSCYFWSADEKTTEIPGPASPRQPLPGRAQCWGSWALVPSLHPPPAPAQGWDHLRPQPVGAEATGTQTRVTFLNINYSRA